LAVLNTYTVLPVTKMLSALHKAKQTRSHGYHCSNPTLSWLTLPSDNIVAEWS